jgi:hypothetical protein
MVVEQLHGKMYLWKQLFKERERERERGEGEGGKLCYRKTCIT